MAEKANAPNWDALMHEYIETDISIRGLAQKYSLPRSTVFARAKRDKWATLRGKTLDETRTKLVQDSASARAQFAQKLDNTADELLDRVRALISSSTAAAEAEKLASALEKLYKLKGLDAASLLEAQRAASSQPGGEDSADDGFIDAMRVGSAEAWAIDDVPGNLHDGEDE